MELWSWIILNFLPVISKILSSKFLFFSFVLFSSWKLLFEISFPVEFLKFLQKYLLKKVPITLVLIKELFNIFNLFINIIFF